MQRRQWTFGAGGALLAGLLGVAALPVRAQDDGEFTILHARYGTEVSHVDVTERLRDLARRDQRVRVTNELFGGADPAPGRQKTLRVFVRDRQGRDRTLEFRERDWVDGSVFAGWSRGNWGQGDWQRGWNGTDDRPGYRAGNHRANGNSDGGEYTILYATYGTQRREVDVTQRLRELAQRDQRFQASNQLLGVDPDSGRTKTLRIVARDRRGVERTFDYREDAWVDGAQFVGWGSGNWGPSRQQGNQLWIESASYGSDGRWVDVTRVLREHVRNNRFDGEVSNGLLGYDPAPGRRKTLRVTYRVGNGALRNVDVAENDRIRLP